MRKNVFGRQFKRDANERKALFKNLLTSLVLEERIQTTPEKAKAIRAAADKLVTKAKKGGDAAFRALAPEVNHTAVVKLVNDIAPRFINRQGGYTRIVRVGRRIADNAPQAIMEWVERASANVEPKTENKESAKAKKSKGAKEVKPKKAASNAVKEEKSKATSNVAKSKDKKEVKK